VDELHRHRSFTYSGSHPFYGAVTDIAHRKDARNIRLQQERVPVQRPCTGTLAVVQEIRTRQQKAALIPLDSFRELAFGMAVGLLIDALIVRALLVPALISIVGPASGWPGKRPGAEATEEERASTDPSAIDPRTATRATE